MRTFKYGGLIFPIEIKREEKGYKVELGTPNSYDIFGNNVTEFTDTKLNWLKNEANSTFLKSIEQIKRKTNFLEKIERKQKLRLTV